MIYRVELPTISTASVNVSSSAYAQMFSTYASPAGTGDSGSSGNQHTGVSQQTHDADMVVVEVSSLDRAITLMCDRKLRPPLPLGLPKGMHLRCFLICCTNTCV